GAVMAGVSYFVAAGLLGQLSIGFEAYARYVAPPIEELLKAAIVVALIRGHRIGFLVDAAILGFAAGTGFALGENFNYLRGAEGDGVGLWLARGFGTAIMHGGVTAIFAVMAQARVEGSPEARWR